MGTAKNFYALMASVCVIWAIGSSADGQETTDLGRPAAKLVSVEKIWEQAPHNAFTDLVRWRDRFYCAFREGKGHAGDRGNLRIIVSSEGKKWESAGLLTHEEFDLRDAALSVTPDGKLMVLGGAQKDSDKGRLTGTFVSFSRDGKEFDAPKLVIQPGRWLWRVTWQNEQAYGVSYGTPDDAGRSALLRSGNGIDFETVTDTLLDQGERPTEARVRFDETGTCFCLHRRDGSKQNSAMLGISKPPYTSWDWKDLDRRLGGPNFVWIPGSKSRAGCWIAVGRLYDGGARTEVCHLDIRNGKLTPILKLPSGGDTSYPGLIWHDDELWISYYSSHEGKTSIYLARVQIENPVTIPNAVDIGARRELFVDTLLVDQINGCGLKLHAPQLAEGTLKFDKPWEGAFCGYCTVIKDGEKYRMYYRGLPTSGRDGTDSEVTCYAESDDAIVWTKPELGIHELDGSSANNIVLKGQTPASHNFSPFHDANPLAKSEQRYKALGGNDKGLIAFTSPDGIRWTRMQDEPVFRKGIFDSQNVSFWSVHEQKYVCYFRTWTGGGYQGFRTISRTTSDDFLNWTDPQPMSFGDTPVEHLYTNQTAPYFRAPHVYVGLAARFMPGRRVVSSDEAKKIGVDPRYSGDCSDTVLLTTRGESRYDRTFMESFIRPGLGAQNWVSRSNYSALGIVPTGTNEMSLFMSRNYGQPSAYMQRYKLRVDGIASIGAGFDGGELVTKPIRFGPSTANNGPWKMHLNFSTSAAGSIQVELQDETGNPIEGFSRTNCDLVVGDQVDRVLSWKGESDLTKLVGRSVRIRFVVKDADIFSFQFTPSANP